MIYYHKVLEKVNWKFDSMNLDIIIIHIKYLDMNLGLNSPTSHFGSHSITLKSILYIILLSYSTSHKKTSS